MGEDSIMQVFTVSEDGTRLSGRWFLENADAIGGDLTAVRMDPDSPAQIMAVVPAYLKSGSTAQIAIHGVGLSGDVSLGKGVNIGKTVSQSAETVVVEATAKADAGGGKRVVTVGEVQATQLFTVYPRVESVRVEPDYAIARVGDQEGPLPPVPAQFDAVAYLNGPDGKAGTEDDLRIGVMPASWSVENFNELAAEMDDVKFAGAMQADGLFMPAGAGPNPERRYQTNNVGDLTVKAIVTDADKELEGKGHLIVTVQRWNDPPIR